MKRYIKSAVVSPSEEPSEVKTVLAKDPRTSSQVLDQLIKPNNSKYLTFNPDDLDAVCEVAKNPKASADALRTIYNWGVLIDKVFINHPNTPDDVLQRIIERDRFIGSAEQARQVLDARRTS